MLPFTLAETYGSDVRDVLSFFKDPNLIFDLRFAPILSNLFPEARYVVVLREPVERAFSHYRHTRQRGYVSGSFEEAKRPWPRRLTVSRRI